MRAKFSIFISILIVLSLFSVKVRADIGPKSSVVISFENIGTRECYGTLLSESKTTGPYTEGNEIPGWMYEKYGSKTESIVNAFKKYQDEDGFYFLSTFWKCSEEEFLDWNYYPPERFKLLLYFPETESFKVSRIYQGYAFDSSFSTDVEAAGKLVLKNNYDYKGQALGILFRTVLTIIIELAVALLFGFFNKKLIGCIVKVNIATQLGLNLLLNFIVYMAGGMAFVLALPLLEVVVIAVENQIYKAKFNKPTGEISGIKIFLYAFTANIASVAAGIMLEKVFPVWF